MYGIQFRELPSALAAPAPALASVEPVADCVPPSECSCTFHPLWSNTSGTDTGMLKPALELEPDAAVPPDADKLIGIMVFNP